MKISLELRPCIVKNNRALFHGWSDGIVVNGLGDCIGAVTTAIVEYEDGTVTTVYPGAIKFIDSKHTDYMWFDELTKEDVKDTSGLRGDAHETNTIHNNRNKT